MVRTFLSFIFSLFADQDQKLVELISALQTTPDTLDRARSFAIACGKGAWFSLWIHLSFTDGFTEVTTSKDVPGFVSNALLMPFINEVTPIVCASKSTC